MAQQQPKSGKQQGKQRFAREPAQGVEHGLPDIHRRPQQHQEPKQQYRGA